MTYKLASRLTNVIVTLLAAGTIADQVTRTFTLNPNVLLVVWAVTSAALFIAIRLFRKDSSLESSADVSPTTVNNRQFVFGVAFAALLAIVASMSRGTFANISATLVLVIVIGLALNQLRVKPSNDESSTSNYWLTRTGNIFLTACMAVGAAFTSITYRPNTDDHYYVNLSTYIFQKGIIPTRDTVLSDQYFRTYARGSSWEVLWGALGHALHVQPAFLLYVVVPPIASALGIYVVARLLTLININRPAVALCATTIFLAFDGANGYTFGGFQGPRSWQGKSFFLTIFIPLFFVAIIELIRRKNRETSLFIVLLAIASVGTTTTTFFVGAPLLVAGVIAAFALNRSALPPIAIAASYVVVTALWFRQLQAGAQIQSLHVSGMGYSFKEVSHSAVTVMPSTFQLVTGMAKPAWHAFVFGLAMALGLLAVNNKIAKTLFIVSAGIWAAISLPYVHEFIFTATGSKSIGYRLMWLIPIPMLVGAAASYIVDYIAQFNNSKTVTRTISIALVGSLAALPMTLGTPPWKPLTLIDAQIAKPTLLRTGLGYTEAINALNKVAQKGDVVLARNGVSASLAAMTTDYFTVAPRDTYTWFATAGNGEGFTNERLKLSIYIVGDETVTYEPGELQTALDKIRVNDVCLPQDRQADIDLFKSMGYSAKEAKAYNPGNKSRWFWCGRTVKYDH